MEVIEEETHGRPSSIRFLIFRPRSAIPLLASRRPDAARFAFLRSNPGSAGTSRAISFPMAGYQYFRVALYLIKQGAQLVLCLKCSSFPHRRSPASSKSSLLQIKFVGPRWKRRPNRTDLGSIGQRPRMASLLQYKVPESKGEI